MSAKTAKILDWMEESLPGDTVAMVIINEAGEYITSRWAGDPQKSSQALIKASLLILQEPETRKA